MSVEDGLNADFLDLLAAFGEGQVEFLVVGAHALAAHGIPRATGDLDLWIRPTNKRATGRDKDLLDVKLLERASPK